MLEVRGLSVAYGQHRALEDVSVRVKPGEIVVILGANGAGKSSLLKAISGVSEGRVTGSVMLDGEEQVGRRAHDIVEAGIALVPEGRGVFPELTVRENLKLGAHGPRARGDEAANLDRVLGLFPKLAEREGQVVRTMSGGEQQMVAIGRAMMSNPTILTLDEPSLGLSPLLCKELFRNLARVRDLGLGVLLVEQNARQSLAIADRGYLLENARIVHQDTAAALANDPAVQAAYLGAGGAAPQTQDAAPSKVDAAAIAAEAIQRFEMRPRAEVTRSADAVLGRSVADLVAQAAERSTRAVAETRATRPAMPDTAAHGDRLRATLDDIARAAAAARRSGPVVVRERPMPARPTPERPTPAQAAATTQAPPDPGPRPVIEVYRAPRVEVYRRRPTGEFHRD
ncbi:MAG: ABC transporter ATP-binding protein [Rhodobacteraceae bacterium]|jgi:branched-chain amino acid transport system ATP-binding protein|nr:ABC transporter ATP-binding protein [Paracoccaceae bacterium]